MPTLLTINTKIPLRAEPGTPALVFFDNGDWSIEFAGDVDYIKGNAASFLGSPLVVDVINAFNLEYDFSEAEEDDDGILLFVSETINEGSIVEPMIVIYDDGEFDLYDRYTAEKLVAATGSHVFNFISYADFLSELRTFVSRKGEEMWDGRENDLEMEHDADPEDQ